MGVRIPLSPFYNLLTLLDTLVAIWTLIMPNSSSMLILIITFIIKERLIMTNNEGVVNCDDYVGKPSYCPYYRIEYVYRPQ